MKKIIFTAGLMLTMIAAYSQNYWVVETDTTKRSIIRIYSADDKLVSERRVERRIDTRKKRERRILNRMASRSTRNDLVWSKR